MSKLFNVTKKGTLWSVLLAVVLAAGLVFGIVFGFNQSATTKDANVLTVTVDSLTFKNDLNDVQNECEKVFDAKGVDYTYSIVSEMYGNDCEVVYVFDVNTDLETVKGELKTSFANLTKEGGALDGAWITFSSNTEVVKETVPQGYALRGAIALVVMAVLAFAYTAIRYRWDMGVMMSIAVVLGAVLTTALIAIVRIPVTNSLMYVVALGALFAAVTTLLTMNKISKKEFKADVDSKEEMADCVAVKDIVTLGAVTAAALVVVGVAGAIANVTLVWFALSVLVAVVASVVIGLIYVPVYFLPLKTAADKKVADKASGYKGAQKTAAAVKKLFAKKEQETDESEEA